MTCRRWNQLLLRRSKACFFNKFISNVIHVFTFITAVKSIKKAHLVEVRNLPNPPKTVKVALESIVILMGESSTDWKSIRQIIAKDNFVPNVVKFSTEDITDEARHRLNKDYLSDPNFNYETVNHASRACGPLVKWAIAQVCH